ncbi:caspase family protein [Sorangium sp. So ce1000]|uniref:caspase family protein n=1 Tax=Sorangium sp. So ce1000 TaxID=3133325 RepID=UPI003F636917
MADPQRRNANEPPTDRNVRPITPSIYGTYAEKWAVIVGISRYKDASLNLNYAARDAEDLDKLLRTGCGFKSSNVQLLLDEQATTGRITWALRSFLKKAARDDIIVLYFACHGQPDVGVRGNIFYLITWDTDAKDIGSTALPMREVQNALNDYVLAERGVILVDACHGSPIGDTTRARDLSAGDVMNQQAEALSKVQAGIATISSTRANETAQEGPQWDGGHGVFTYFLLKGLSGEAAEEETGKVTVSSLYDYVSKNVTEATEPTPQHPWISGNGFDNNLPLAWRATLDNEERLALGRDLADLGRLLGDRISLDLASELFVEDTVDLGLARLDAGDSDRAIPIFQAVVSQGGAGAAESAYYLGVALAMAHDEGAAKHAIASFLAKSPDDPRAAFARALLTDPERRASTGTRRALLIGVGPPARGTNEDVAEENDARSLREVLIERWGFAADDAILLLGPDATRDGILGALETLVDSATEDDAVVVFYSGCRGCSPLRDYAILPYRDSSLHPADDGGRPVPTIAPDEIHGIIKSIRARRKTLIMDSDASPTLIDLARGASYAALFGASVGRQALTVHIDERHGRRGLFSWALVEQLTTAPPSTTLEELRDEIAKSMQTYVDRREQDPHVSGTGSVSHRLEPVSIGHLMLFELSRRRRFDGFARHELEMRYDVILRAFPAAPPDLHYAAGRGFLEQRAYDRAAKALALSAHARAPSEPEALMAAAVAQIGAGQREAAADSLNGYLGAFTPPEQAPLARDVTSLLARLRRGNRFAVIVGIDAYGHPGVPRPAGAVNDARALFQVLIDRYGFLPENVRVLLDGAASRAAILAAFKDLAAKSEESAALFYFAGNGSFNASGHPTIVSADGRSEGVFDIPLRELGELAGRGSARLVTLVDAGWTSRTSAEGARYVEADPRPVSLRRALTARRFFESPLRVGRLTALNGSINMARASEDWPKVESVMPLSPPGSGGAVHGLLTHEIVRVLRAAQPTTLTWRGLFEVIQATTNAQVTGEGMEEIAFDDRLLDSARACLTNLDREPARRALAVLERADIPHKHLWRGIAYSVLENYKESIETLDAFIRGKAGERSTAAHYHLGRVLFESRYDLDRAVSELRWVTQRDPANAAAFLYLARALCARAESDIRGEAAMAYATYLDSGAPPGYENEAWSFLTARKSNMPRFARLKGDLLPKADNDDETRLTCEVPYPT